MNTLKQTSSSSATTSASTSLRVWDLPTRLFHWVLLASVVGLVITGNVGGNAMAWHFRLGYLVASLLLFRVVWGFLGGYWSRFAQFVYAPSRILAYIKGQASMRERIGHNPLGALSVFALLGLLILQVASGLFSDDEIAFFGPLTRLVSSDVVSQASFYHAEVGKTALIVLVLLHVVSVLYYLFKKRQNLIRPMVLGDKEISKQTEQLPQSLDNAKTRLLALVVFALCAGLVYAVVMWAESLPPPAMVF